VHRAVLLALIPSLIALASACALLRLVCGISGARLNLKRIRRLHSCQHGGVQTLSFVLTLPLFIMIVLFIVQVSQLMIGIMSVHYAAFAAARSAVVWTAAHSDGYFTGLAEEVENVLQPPLTDDRPLDLEFNHVLTSTGSSGGVDFSSVSGKLNKLFGAAVMGCAAASPSRPLAPSEPCFQCGVYSPAIVALYGRLVPGSAGNARTARRLDAKISYAYWNTRVRIGFLDQDSLEGPTYNPRVLRIVDGMASVDEEGEWIRDWIEHEVGWQDPLVLTVQHDFALLPGPGRFLAKYIVRGDGQTDRVASRVELKAATRSGVPYQTPVYTTSITASATLTTEGLKPLLSYVQNHE